MFMFIFEFGGSKQSQGKSLWQVLGANVTNNEIKL
jgi:hypothetical protein